MKREKHNRPEVKQPNRVCFSLSIGVISIMDILRMIVYLVKRLA